MVYRLPNNSDDSCALSGVFDAVCVAINPFFLPDYISVHSTSVLMLNLGEIRILGETV